MLGWALALAALVGVVGCYSDVKVVQGAVTSVEPDGSGLVLRDERPPNAAASYRLVERATVAPGDAVRVAYRDRGEGRVVVRLMNLTRHKAKNKSDKE
jgi:hypothetical protein